MGEEGECGCGGNEVRCGGCVGLESVNLFRYTGGEGKLICCLGVCVEGVSRVGRCEVLWVYAVVWVQRVCIERCVWCVCVEGVCR